MRAIRLPSVTHLAVLPTAVIVGVVAAVATVCWPSGPASAQHARVSDAQASARTGAPYILVTSKEAQVDSLPLEASKAEVQIAGVMAHVTVTQVYRNRGQVPLEATYVFPGSTRAAVFGMQMTVGDVVTRAQIAERGKARKRYERAREEGKTASLLEQHRPNVFQMSVANILPGDTVEVELRYTEYIEPTDGIYEFVYPAVVGPRYAGEQTSGETWHKNQYGPSGAGAPYRYGVDVRIATGVPLYGLTSPSHEISPRFLNANRARLSLSSHRDGDRDFVLRYRLRGGEVATGLLRFEGERENFFLLMVQPPKRVTRADMPAREYVFIVDVSGSMSGFPLGVSKKLVSDLLRGLREIDSFNILFFSGGSYQLSPHSVTATPRNVARALRVLDQRRGGGGTNLVAALHKALHMPASPGTARTFVAVTDGYISADDKAFATVRENLGEANFFAFGIGSSVNRNLIEGLARAGMGEPFVVLNDKQAPKKAKAFRKLIEAPLLTDIKARFRGFDAYDVVPGRIPDLFAERPLVIFGKYRGQAAGSIEITGISGGGKFNKSVSTDSAPPSPDNAGLRYLWARQRIAELSDRISVRPTKELSDAVTKLGLRYSLLTKYTSFVAVDERIRNRSGHAVGVSQPLPTPAGVSNPYTAAAQRQNIPTGRSFGGTIPGTTSSGDEVIVVTGRSVTPGGGSIRLDNSDVGPGREYEELSIISSLPGVAHVGDMPVPIRGAQPLDERSSTISPAIVRGLALSQRVRAGTRDNSSLVALPTLLRVGFANTLEARVGTTLYTRALGDTVRPDLILGAKLRMKSTWYPLAVALFADYRRSFDEVESEQSRTRLAFLASLSLSRYLSVRLNLGGAYRQFLSLGGNGGNGNDGQLGLLYGLDVAVPNLATWGKFALYPHIGVAGITGAQGRSTLELGTAAHIGRSWALGLLLQLGLDEDSDDRVGGLLLRYTP